ncbi:MAG: DUF3793 family protein [Peptococcales bacterium]|jgi:hypothetical protein
MSLDINKEFQNVLIRLSPVFMGIKPGELLNIKWGNNLERCYHFFRDSQIKHIEIKDFPNLERRQLFFYHRECLAQTLQVKANQNFLRQIGYPLDFQLASYLEILTSRLRSDAFPHEIGVFLGYPLKDVLGYMGILPLKLVKIKGWKYYGSEKLSAIQYKRYVKARDIFRVFLDTFQNQG